jgi:peptide-methionine (S)-S-oxide reductase
MQITYEELLTIFWDSHSPTIQPWSRQYMSIIFYHSEEQRAASIESKERHEEKLGHTIVTEITPFSEFYLAEDYHQKHYLTSESDLVNELREIYPDIHDFIASTAAARLNGYIGGFGTLESLEKNLDSFGLSKMGKIKLLEITKKGIRAGCLAL